VQFTGNWKNPLCSEGKRPM